MVNAHSGYDGEVIEVQGQSLNSLLADSAVKVTMIDQQTVEQLSIGTLRQVLEVIPGVTVNRSMKDGYNVQLNGFGGDHVLVLINGRAVVNPTGSSTDLDQISVQGIKRIEVLRGAASVVHGSAAMGGVINIITEQTQQNAVSLKVLAHDYPDYDSQTDSPNLTAQLNASVHWGSLVSRINHQIIEESGFDYDPETISQDAGALEKTFSNLHTGLSLDAWSIAYDGQRLNEFKNKPQFRLPGQDTLISYQSDVEQWQHNVNIKHDESFEFNARYQYHDEISGNTNSQRRTEIELNHVDIKHAFSALQTGFIAGLQYSDERLNQIKLTTSQREVDNAQRESTEAFVQGTYALEESGLKDTALGNGDLVAGLRIQDDSGYGIHTAVKANMVFRDVSLLGKPWMTRVNLATSYRTPNLKERFFIFDHSNLGYMVLGNAQLQPETAKSINLGWQTRCSDSTPFDISFNLHALNAKDFIQTQLDREATAQMNLAISRYENVESVKIQGFDLDLSGQFSNIDWQLNYAYINAKNALTGDRLSARPRHLLKGQIKLQPFNQQHTLYVYAVHQRDVAPLAGSTFIANDTFTTLNANYRYAYNEHIALRISAENITNTHQDPDAIFRGGSDARPLSARKISMGFDITF